MGMFEDGLDDLRAKYGDQISRKFHDDIIAEVMGARRKFGGVNNPNFGALIEEVGELAKDLVQQSFEPHKMKTGCHVYTEAVQVAAMALRLACEGDPAFPAYHPSLDDAYAFKATGEK